MLTESSISAMFARLGVVRCDLRPPELGRIRFLDGGNHVVAEGDFRVLLMFGPGDEYTHAWALGSARGMPCVTRDDAPGRMIATKEQARARAEELAARDGADFVWRLERTFISVHNFHEVTDPLKATRRRREDLWADLTVRSLMKIVRETNWREIEEARDEVGVQEVPGLVRDYWTLCRPEQKAAFVLLVQDAVDAALEPVFRNVLDLAGPQTARVTAAKAIARNRLAMLDDFTEPTTEILLG